MSDTTAAPDVHRLLDIVVEEVSLVDRAANKHRFLIVKRSDPMDENEQDAASEEDQTNGPDADDKTENQRARGMHADVLAIAVAALQALTEAVELLASEDEMQTARIAEISAELHRVADQLTAMTASDAPEDAGALLGSAEEVLAQDHGRSPAAPITAAMSAERAESAALAKELADLIGAVRTLTSTVTAQQQRLSKLEKHHGLPNSRPPGERTTQRDDETGWPLDLNKPYDRHSVDKSVSFHDV